MDNRNVFVAIALSMSVLLFWGAFFETPKKPIEQKNGQKVEQKSEQSSITPTIDQPTIIKNISREDSLNKSKRVKIEHNSIIGSIHLQGAQIDDISFKKHKQKVDGNENIIFLNPAETENGFYIETGWTSIGNKIKIPTKESVWSVKGNDILSNSSPVVLQWNNGEGVLFEKKFVSFAYRWKYYSGEYSTFSPFSELAFLPDTFEYLSTNGYNDGMINNLRQLKIPYLAFCK